ncbi:biopolymer transporter ExbD [Allofranklinella schreckenbergeri]|uniref:Biopolymer transporter ExbD n=1 Tax=Allofranklinella schreckenbergeri TaxID=1076744 RepID=A0A3M6PYP3_9BURK|nr:biopolymer transporter ExbD [Allofranklinella schreckenbergeri]RMW96163.1 biopolymer transporter ExbD [Allofranklinella schreckenbergeri]RMX07084.1 biopolymer transporter ExbD [Allofranklinella schreckenbergeri]
MAFSNLEDSAGDVMSEINMVPLIDIMLVLLIIFIITVPAINETIKVNLPEAASQEKEEEPDKPVNLSIDLQGVFYIDKTALTDDQLKARLAEEAKKEPAPALYINGDKDVNYGRIINAMDLARQAGLSKIGFVTDPNGEAGTVNPSEDKPAGAAAGG